jgi:hypothetical protein
MADYLVQSLYDGRLYANGRWVRDTPTVFPSEREAQAVVEEYKHCRIVLADNVPTVAEVLSDSGEERIR